jgi:hypothetical protein
VRRRGAGQRVATFEQSTTFELVMDACPAMTAGLTVTPALLLRSEHLIE